MVDNIGPNQIAFYSVVQANYIARKEAGIDFTIFVENIVEPPIRPLCAVMNNAEMMSFDGILIATSFSGAEKILKAVNTSEKVFYVYNLEWLSSPQSFQKYVSILRHPELKIFTRSQQYAKAIEKYAGVKVRGISPNMNVVYIGETIAKS